MQFLTSVLVRTSSLLLALYTTSRSLVFLVTAVQGVKVMTITGHSLLPFLTFRSPREVPRVQPQRTVLDVASSRTDLVDPLGRKLKHSFLTQRSQLRKQHTFVFAGGLPISNFLFFLSAFLLPPVALRLCQLSREIPRDKIETRRHVDEGKRQAYTDRHSVHLARTANK